MKPLHKTAQLIFLIFVLGLPFISNGQNSVGINTSSPNPNAVLHLMSPNSNQGLLIPALTTAQRTALVLVDTDNGLLVYDNEEGFYYYWHNGKWNRLNPILLDNDETNELQDLSYDGINLNITNGNGLDISNWDTDATDDILMITTPEAGDISGSYAAGFMVVTMLTTRISPTYRRIWIRMLLMILMVTLQACLTCL